jgi:hypothetical protein
MDRPDHTILLEKKAAIPHLLILLIKQRKRLAIPHLDHTGVSEKSSQKSLTF